MYYKLQIEETGRNSLKEQVSFFNTIIEEFSELSEVKNYLAERYGKIPKGKNKVYQDTKQGESLEVGFLHSFWNQDVSHNSKSWFQTDWISISEVTEKPVLLN